MASRLQQVLRGLCFNTGWKYAVFWKLKHRSRMMFTWEDAYYDNTQYPDKKWFNAIAGSSNEGPYSHDPLGLAVAKMSYQVYSLGEGIVGQVAVSGKHSWIYLDQLVADPSSSSEYCSEWQTQFSAGIKTVVVVAVIPHGVVQLGSLHKIAEDLKLIDQIRNVFSKLHDSLADYVPSSTKSDAEVSCVSDTWKRISDSAVQDTLAKLKESYQEDEGNLWSQLSTPLGESVSQSNISMVGFSNNTLKMKMPERADCSMLGNEISLPSSCERLLTRQLTEEGMESLDNAEYGGETNGFSDLTNKTEVMIMPSDKNVRIENSNFHKATIHTNGSEMITSNHAAEILDSPAFSFSAGYELYEALGTSFHKHNGCAWESGKSGSDMAIEISEGIGSCSLLTDSSDMHLLDAVVAKISCHKADRTESEKSCRETNESLLTAERTPCNSIGTISSAGYSCFSSTSSSRGSEHLERPREAAKANKKRARPGESCRPRPRDRQLIQDRIKELRDLVPNGSKCSIDSLLERTIKHMLFMQSITKHAEKLHKCSASKLLDKEIGMRRFSCREQGGSSWAVEVGNNQKVCPIIVENINMNGLMLVEMMCKECSDFLEVAETIRSLGLTILKGVSEAYGDRTWICFVVEEQNNRSMHRMDVLWSLMQLLQPKISD